MQIGAHLLPSAAVYLIYIAKPAFILQNANGLQSWFYNCEIVFSDVRLHTRILK